MIATTDCLEQLFEVDPSTTLYQVKETTKRLIDTLIEEQGLPNRKTEKYRYAGLKRIYKHQWSFPDPIISVTKEEIAQESDTHTIVFIDGIFSKALSQIDDLEEGIVVEKIEDAIAEFGFFIQDRLMKKCQEEADLFEKMALLKAQEGCFIYIPKETNVKKPICILHMVTQEGKYSTPNLVGFVGNWSNVTFVTKTHHTHEGVAWVNELFDITVEKGAAVRFEQDHIIPRDVFHFHHFHTRVKEEGIFDLFTVSRGSHQQVQNYGLDLLGPNARGSVKGTSICQQKDNAHTNVRVHHFEPSCISDQHFKGALLENAKASFSGLIKVEKKAQQTVSYQLNNYLLLDQGTAAFSKPTLEIGADDVKASHGATFARLSDEELFYIRTRGLSEKEARLYLIRGFCMEIIDQLTYPQLKARAIQVVQEITNRVQ